MNKGLVKNILLVLLLTITAFSIFRYLMALKDKYELTNALNDTRAQVDVLQNEKQNLLETLKKEEIEQENLMQANSQLKDNLRAGQERIHKLFADVQEAQKQVEQLNNTLSLSQAENKALKEEEENLKLELSQASEENSAIKARFDSLEELKKAIRELKKKMRNVRFEIKPAKAMEQERIIEGNRGYLLKDGKFTLPSRVRIEVVPAPEKE